MESGINLAEEGQEQVVSEKEMLAESFQSIGSLQDACENTAKGIDHALTQMNHCYLTVSDQIDQAFAILGEDTASFEKDIEETIKDVQILTSDLNTMKKNLQGFRDTLPDQGADLQGKLDQLISDMDQVLRIQNELSEGLKTDLEITQSIGGNSQKYKDALKALIAKSSDAITDMQKDYHQNMEGEIAGIFERTEVMHQSIYTLIDQLEEASEDGMRTTKNTLHDPYLK